MTNNMKKAILILIVLLACSTSVAAQGLRHSVCIVEQELTQAEKSLYSDYSLYMARAGMQSASRALTAYRSEGSFGSGVLIEQDNKKYVLTNLHVVGYAQNVTISFELHEKKLRYPHCRVVATSPACDLAAIELPSENELIALPLYSGEVTEEMAVVAAGFPGLANKPSWQMTRGFISNARLEIDEPSASHIIQHSASIDPGSSGGPLLYKGEDNKYVLLGINTWKAFYREGVGMAIGVEDIKAFLDQIDSLPGNDAKALDPLKATSGEDWLYVFRHLPDSTQQSLKKMNWRMPFDPALRTLAIRDSIVATNAKGAKQYKKSATRVETELDHRNHVYAVYDNYLGINQQVGVQIGHDFWGILSTGLQITALMADVMTENDATGAELGYELRAGAMFCAYMGVQVPIVIGDYLLVPRITQSGGAGPMKTGNINAGFDIIADTRVGLDWRIPFSDCDLVLGLHYDMNWLWTKDKMNMPIYKTTSGFTSFNQYLQHGVGLTIGVAW